MENEIREIRENLLNLINADHEIKMKKNRIFGKRAYETARLIIHEGDDDEVKNLFNLLNFFNWLYSDKKIKINYFNRSKLKKGYLAIEMFNTIKRKKETEEKI